MARSVRTSGFSLLLTLAVMCPPALGEDGGVDFRPAMREARTAYQKRDFVSYLAAVQRAAAIEPNHPMVLHNLAGAYALTNHPEEALATLDRLIALQVDLGVEGDSDFQPLRTHPGFLKRLEAFKALHKPLGKSELAFHLEDPSLLVEGIAFDAKTGRFLLSSVHQRKVVSFDPKTGKSEDKLSSGQDGLGGVLGVEVDAKRRRLWVVSAHLPEMEGFHPEDAGRTAVAVFHLDSGKLIRRLAPPPDSHSFNDLVLTRDGGAYVADSRGGGIFAVTPAGELRPFLPEGTFASPGGLALSPDEKTLLVAAWGRGLHAVHLRSRRVRAIEMPPGLTLYGLDSIRLHRGKLIATQNGVKPDRVLRLTLDRDWSRVTQWEVLERAHPLFDEPTLGVMVGDAFFYVANSQWERFGPHGENASGAREKPVVLKLSL